MNRNSRQRLKFKAKSYSTTRYTKNRYTANQTTSKHTKSHAEDTPINDDDFQSLATAENQQPTIALFDKYALINAIDLQMGFIQHSSSTSKRGWLINIQTVPLFVPIITDIN